MLDIQFIRANPELVQEKSKQKQVEVDVPKLLELDRTRRELQSRIEELRTQRNILAGQTKEGKPSEDQIKEGRDLKDQVTKLESELEPIEHDYWQILKSVPNVPLDDVPVGNSEDENVVARQVGVKRDFYFEPKNHYEIGEAKGWIDKERASKVAGARFAYLKGDLVRLQWALMNWAMDKLTSEVFLEHIIRESKLDVSAKPFTPVLPPLMIRTEVYAAMDRLEPEDDRYKIEGEELWLQGSAEHTLGSMHINEILEEKDFPVRYVGFATSFRKEAGTYGKDLEGIIRMHQFDKLEMESLTTPETALHEHLLMIGIQEQLMKELQLPYQVLNKCTADIGKPNARGWDIEVWLPGQNKYRETHTADYMTDYQARRLQTRVRRANGDVELVHTNDATAFAQRALVGIIENYQTHDGHVVIPEVLQPYMGGRTEI
jgi:seryl-tRNA synthetase